MTHSQVHTVLGAQGSIGRAIIHELAQQGLPVRAVDRAANPARLPPGTEHRAADLTDAADVRRAVQDPAVVYYAAQPDYTRWPELFLPLMDALIGGLSGSGAKLVMVDNLYMYGPHDAPTTETLPLAATDRKGLVRTEIVRQLLAAHQEERFQVTFGRSHRLLRAVRPQQQIRCPAVSGGPRGSAHHLDRSPRRAAQLQLSAGRRAGLCRPRSARRGRRPGLAPAHSRADDRAGLSRTGVPRGRSSPPDAGGRPRRHGRSGAAETP